ncbi:hypothetical protein Tco_1150874 [Tanacetum coccineum]
MGIIGKQNHHDNKISGENIMANQVDGERIILIEEKDLNNEIICRSVTGEVKATCFLYKLPVLCEEQGLNSIEVKLLGGLEVMVVKENEETATNVLKDKDHGLRRWVNKLRSASSINRIAGGRMTWINILGIPVSCWNEGTFKKIAALHGTILAMSTCRLEGNQNIIYGRVHTHTLNKGLIKEELNIKEEGEVSKRDKNVMQVDDEADDEGNNMNEAPESGVNEGRCTQGRCPLRDSGNRNCEEGEGSRFSVSVPNNKIQNGMRINVGGVIEDGSIMAVWGKRSLNNTKQVTDNVSSDQNKNTGDQVKDGSMARREKREMSPTSPTGNNEVRLKKKLKSYQEFLFGGNTIDKTFDKGKLDGEIPITKKKEGRKSVTKVKEGIGKN